MIPMKRLSKAAYFVPTFIGYFLSVPAVLFLMVVFGEGRGRDREVIPFLMIPAMAPMLLGVIAQLVLVYKMWAAIADDRPRTSPGAAVGLVFVPLFNLYWVFQAYFGWTKDFNRAASERGLAVRRAPEGLALAICIFTILSGLPLLGLAFAALNQLLLLVFMNGAINSVNSLLEAKAGAYRATVSNDAKSAPLVGAHSM
jgi:hypothetical protein